MLSEPSRFHIPRSLTRPPNGGCCGLFRIRGPHAGFGNKAPVGQCQHAADGLGNIISDKFGFVERPGSLARILKKLCLHFTGIDLHNPNIMGTQFRTPAFRHTAKCKLAGRISRAAFRTPLAG